MLKKNLLAAALSFISFSHLNASEALVTHSMDEVINKVYEKSQQYSKEQVLVVFDIDNTLLTMENDLGSDQWYSWQETLMKNPNCRPECVSPDINTLLRAQGILFSVGKMLPTEQDLAAKVKRLQDEGLKVILLTSRGHDFRNATEAALKSNGFDFSRSSLNPAIDQASTYLPFTEGDYKASGIDETEVQLAGLKSARPVSFQNGIYMTSGQNKGIMLKTLLHRYQQSYKAIIFADDHERHTVRMQQILGDETDLSTYRYGRLDQAVKDFQEKDKTEVVSKWEKLVATLNEIGFSF